jgi:MazG family protein
MSSPDEGRGIDRLLAVMARLRAPEGGCPWDLEQRFETIAPYTIEEAYEVAEAVERGDPAALKDELGDLLFQIVFHGRLGEEQNLFDFDSIARHSADKMIRRHPHVFADRVGIETAADQAEAWEVLKAAERAASPTSGALDGVTPGLPALTRAVKIQNRASRVGFDWREAAPVLDKIDEELAEIRAELANGAIPDRVEDEVGDLLFAVANLARHLGLDAEGALRRATAKFERRFRRMEALAAEAGDTLAGQDPTAQNRLWDRVKAEEQR